MVVLWFVPLDTYVLFYAASAIGVSLLGCELWRSRSIARFLSCAVPAVLCPLDSCHSAWILAAVACGLSHSFCASSPLG